MKLFIKILILLCCIAKLAYGYIPVICSSNGGICKLEDINLLAVKFMDEASNYVYNFYIIYCRYVCSLVQYAFAAWNKYTHDKYSKSTDWRQEYWQKYISPLAIWFGFEQRKEEYIEEMICKSSAPILAIAFSLAFCGLALYFRKKPKKTVSSSKLDISAYCQEVDEDEMRSNSTFSTLINTYDQRSCCGCKATISDISERSESIL